MKKYLIVLFVILIGLFFGFGIYYSLPLIKTEETIKEENKPSDSVKDTTSKIEEKTPKTTTISVNAVGDCTIGKDSKFGYALLTNITIIMELVIFLVKSKIYLLMMI